MARLRNCRLCIGLGSEYLYEPDGLSATRNQKGKNKHWVWINPNQKEDVAVLKKRYKAYYDAGIRGILFEADSEKHYTEAKNAGLEAHRWNWTMNRGDCYNK